MLSLCIIISVNQDVLLTTCCCCNEITEKREYNEGDDCGKQHYDIRQTLSTLDPDKPSESTLHVSTNVITQKCLWIIELCKRSCNICIYNKFSASFLINIAQCICIIINKNNLSTGYPVNSTYWTLFEVSRPFILNNADNIVYVKVPWLILRCSTTCTLTDTQSPRIQAYLI